MTHFVITETTRGNFSAIITHFCIKLNISRAPFRTKIIRVGNSAVRCIGFGLCVLRASRRWRPPQSRFISKVGHDSGGAAAAASASLAESPTYELAAISMGGSQFRVFSLFCERVRITIMFAWLSSAPTE